MATRLRVYAVTDGVPSEDLGSLYESLEAVLGMFFEYRDKHGHGEEYARWAALSEVMDGTEARLELKTPAGLAGEGA